MGCHDNLAGTTALSWTEKDIFFPNAPPVDKIFSETLEIPRLEKAENKLTLPDTLVEWLEPYESAKRLREILGFLQKGDITWYATDRTAMIYKTEEKSPEALVNYLLQILFSAHILLVEKINKKPLSVKVPWDKATGFPSPPTLAADAAVFAGIDNGLKNTLAVSKDLVLAKAFNGWQLLSRETMRCAERTLKLRDVSLEIFVRNNVGVNSGRFCLKNMIAVVSDDPPHIKDHYHGLCEPCDMGKLSRVIHRVEAALWHEKGKELKGELNFAGFADEFDRKILIKEAEGLAKKFVEAASLEMKKNKNMA